MLYALPSEMPGSGGDEDQREQNPSNGKQYAHMRPLSASPIVILISLWVIEVSCKWELLSMSPMNTRGGKKTEADRPRRGAPAQTRDRLVTAAAALFNRAGFHGTDS